MLMHDYCKSIMSNGCNLTYTCTCMYMYIERMGRIIILKIVHEINYECNPTYTCRTLAVGAQ